MICLGYNESKKLKIIEYSMWMNSSLQMIQNDTLYSFISNIFQKIQRNSIFWYITTFQAPISTKEIYINKDVILDIYITIREVASCINHIWWIMHVSRLYFTFTYLDSWRRPAQPRGRVGIRCFSPDKVI